MADKKDNVMLIHGNEACALGALYAGCKFFAGYPITPSTEIAEILSEELPKVGGKFIQMEDEIASICAIVGASIADLKSCTSTSGPGFSLMQEALGYAMITETPCVIFNSMRAGPSTGMPTKASQSDVMQMRWGTHGDHKAIVLCPSTVKECFEDTIRAFNLAERFRHPVIVALDAELSHMKEKFILPEEDELEVIDRKKPDVPPQWYIPFSFEKDFVPAMAELGDEYRYHVTGLTHDNYGFPTTRADEVIPFMTRLHDKIDYFKEEIVSYKVDLRSEDKACFIAYGTTARAVKEAVRICRAKGINVGYIKLNTLWPFPGKALKKYCRKVKTVIIPEMNMGQYAIAVETVLNPDVHRIIAHTRFDGELITPEELVRTVLEVTA